ncbi:MAG TPA: response regulator, partial [Balneolaceae bacterium]|nr:response regulator [Balneolaceae bacterium]
QGNVLGWNKKATSIFYKNEAQILGTPLYKYFEPKESEKLRRYLSKSAEKRKPGAVNSLTLERKTPDLSIRILSLTAAPFSYAEGTQKALILAIKDITEQKRAEEDLQQMNETLEERVAKRTSSLLSYQKQLRSLASQLYKTEEKERHRLAAELHDNLGQMLAVSKMKASLLLNQVSGKALSGVEEIKQSLDDAIVFTRDLMSDLKPPPSLDKEDIRAAIEWLAKKMKKHDLKVVLEDDGQPKKTTEEVQTTLIQAVRELLFNVIKHAKVQEAFVSMSRLDNQVQIIVEDKGEGADIDITTSSSTEKGGFGLFNIKERMDLLGGSFEIDSVPGEGTRVKLLAPLKDDDISADDAAPKAAEKSEKKIKVMLVDDHKMVRKGLKKVVDTENDMVVVAEASDGKEAIASARKTSPDVIIMDVDMPHINGIDATREIMSILPAVRVVGLSSMDDDREVMESMRNAGATAYLSKSEAFETLSATIRSEANK